MARRTRRSLYDKYARREPTLAPEDDQPEIRVRKSEAATRTVSRTTAPKNQLLFPSTNRPRLSAFVPLSVAVKREGGRVLIN